MRGVPVIFAEWIEVVNIIWERYCCGMYVRMRSLFLRFHAGTGLAAPAVLVLLLLLRSPVSGAAPPGVQGLTISAGAGYGTVAGYYGPYFSHGYSVSLGCYYPAVFIHDYVLGEGELRGSRFFFDAGGGSHLEAISMRVGAVVYYPVHRLLYPYGGVMAQESMLRFNAERLGESDHSFKPGAVIKAGFFSWITRHAGTRIGVEYEAMPLSRKVFSAVTVSVSALYRVNGVSGAQQGRDVRTLYREVNALYLNGVRAMNAREHLKAKQSFEELLRMDGDHDLARKNLQKIYQSEKFFDEAGSLERDRHYYDAIKKYSAASEYIGGADERLGALRSMLIGNVPGMERKGIRAYEKKKYGECISLMKKILLIDPGNSTAVLYLPRAERRKQAIERLK